MCVCGGTTPVSLKIPWSSHPDSLYYVIHRGVCARVCACVLKELENLNIVFHMLTDMCVLFEIGDNNIPSGA